MDRGAITDVSFFSEALQETFDLLIYVPANYTPLNQYHICIASDGRDYFQMGGIARLADQLLEDYEMEQTIIVGVPYINAADRANKYIPTGNQFTAYMSFLANELVPYLDEEYSTYGLATGRALIGDSMAGTAALMGVLHYPSIFGKAALQSPFVDEAVLNKVKELPLKEGVSIYHIIGLQEIAMTRKNGEVMDLLTPNRTLHSLMKQQKIDYFYEEFDGNHTWTYWKPDLSRLLVKIFG